MIENEISIGLKTFLRPKKLEKCLRHIEKLEKKPKKVLIADDSPEKAINKMVWEKFLDVLNLEVIKLKPDAGLSHGRNKILNRVETKYTFIIDDDHYLPENILDIKKILEKDDKIGGISPFWVQKGRKFAQARDIKKDKDWFVFGVFDDKKPKAANGIRYFEYDYIPNSTLFKTACLREVNWDENYVIGCEHADFYISHKFNSNWKFAVTPDFEIEHDPGPGILREYSSHRRSLRKLKESRKYLAKKWNVKGYILKDYHEKEYKSKLNEIISTIYYELPYSLQWELKLNGYVDKIKNRLSRITDKPLDLE